MSSTNNIYIKKTIKDYEKNKISKYLEEDLNRNILFVNKKTNKYNSTTNQGFEIEVTYDDVPNESPFLVDYWVEDNNKKAKIISDKIYDKFNKNVSDVDGGCGGGVYYLYDLNKEELYEFLDFICFNELNEWDILWKQE